MSEDEAIKKKIAIEKITSHEADLLAIYKEVYSVLKEADLATLRPDRLDVKPQLKQELGKFDPPHLIDPAKAAAILKAMVGSTSDDKFSLENCYFVQMPSGGQSVSAFVKQRLDDLGIEFHDFWHYLDAKGWSNQPRR